MRLLARLTRRGMRAERLAGIAAKAADAAGGRRDGWEEVAAERLPASSRLDAEFSRDDEESRESGAVRAEGRGDA